MLANAKKMGHSSENADQASKVTYPQRTNVFSTSELSTSLPTTTINHQQSTRMQYIRQPLTHAIRAAPSFYWVALPAMARPVVVPVSIRALHITAPTRAAEDPNGLRNMLPPGFEKLYNSPGAVAAMKRMTELMVEKGFDPRKGEVPSTMQMLKLAANSGTYFFRASLWQRGPLPCPSLDHSYDVF